MAANESNIAKDDLLQQIWSICTTLTEEAMAVASAKAKDAAFDVNRGFVPLKGVFTSPTDKVFEGEKKEGVGYKALKQPTELAGIAVKSAK